MSQVRERRHEVGRDLPVQRTDPLPSVPLFADRSLTKIDVWAVDAYRLHKLEESDDRRRRFTEGRPHADALGRPLEYGWIDDNPAAGKRRRIKVDRSPPPHLESAGQIAAVLDAAAGLDAAPDWLIDDRHPVLATLIFSSLRVHELAALRWGDLDFATSRRSTSGTRRRRPGSVR
jgi:integrase